MSDYSKKQAREFIQKRLDSMDQSVYLTGAGRVRENVRRLIIKERPRSILSYKSMPKWLEIDLSTLETEYPNELFDYVATNLNASQPTSQYDIIFVPLYGFNSGGYRLGHGSGWYDKFLTMQPGALKVGVGLELGLIEFSIEPHDIPMDVIITESRLGTLRKRNHR